MISEKGDPAAAEVSIGRTSAGYDRSLAVSDLRFSLPSSFSFFSLGGDPAGAAR